VVECWRRVEISVLTLALGLDQTSEKSQSAARIVTEGRNEHMDGPPSTWLVGIDVQVLLYAFFVYS
jgi:hypothetical protein